MATRIDEDFTRELLERAYAGERAALERFFVLIYDLTHAYAKARRSQGDYLQYDPDDLVSDVVDHVRRYCFKYSPEDFEKKVLSRFGNWYFEAFRLAVGNHHRRNKKHPLTSIHQKMGGAGEDTDSCLEDVVSDEGSGAKKGGLIIAVKELREFIIKHYPNRQHARIFVDRVFNNESAAAIAEKEGVARGTVDSVISRVRKFLRDEWRTNYYE